MKKFMLTFWKEEEGLETLEMLLIIAIIVVIAVTFKNKIVAWVAKLIQKGDTNINNLDANNPVG
ncbi:hypothetical protein MX629_02735 [Carnobacterium divergens]|uniref:Putative Flagellin Flp1-like domain-containing protein n=1 Tax=Carnobacterium divergens TaxID=2748 RepID=A0AAW8R6L7_CARDV|nr:Flp1 family type IVb pilin [Carnobacterium divergens]MDT1957335.1 hypothetical protein [Carnobacterium divergens]MDT1973305.1 hypothetical protein [Carnobacterium divergens]